jgi:isopentenyl phosphate kinase
VIHYKSDLVLLKMGGSVITDKSRPFTAREDVIRRLGREIKQAQTLCPGLQVIVGHGSGSFGHMVAHQYRTHEGLCAAVPLRQSQSTPYLHKGDDAEDCAETARAVATDSLRWRGYAETARAAARLNRLVTDWLFEEGLPVISFQPSATAWCRGRRLVRLDLKPLRTVLHAGLLPVIYGDVAIDEVQGFTIISTEQIFGYLARQLRPIQIVLASIVDGVYDADPLANPDAVPFRTITPANWQQVRSALGGSYATDVTGGMLSKVQAMVELVASQPELQVHVVSGAIPGRVADALRQSRESQAGTVICYGEMS